MTISVFVHRVRRVLIAAATVKVVFTGISVALVILALATLLDLYPRTSMLAAVVAALVVVAILGWRSRAVGSPLHVALWLEELSPSLHYALVTSVGAASLSPDLEKSVRFETLQPLVNGRIVRNLSRTLLILVLAFTVYLLSPASPVGGGRLQAALSRQLPGLIPPVDKLATIRVRVAAPAYTRVDPIDRTNVASVNVISGSRVTVSGNGDPSGVSVLVDDQPARMTGDADSWFAAFTATRQVSVIRIAFMSDERLLVVEAVPDNPPRVVLTAPLRDTTLRTPSYTVNLHAETTDDFGLAQGYFEYLIVSGSGEAFSGRTVTSAPVQFRARAGSMRTTLDFANLKIAAGDLVSVRAVVRDNNSLTGPGVGTSDTRTFRVARADEYDSVSIEAAAPPPVDSSAMSQRMLILMTEALVKKQKTLPRRQFVNESDDIASMEDRIRKRVYDILYQMESAEGAADVEEAESELQAINDPDLKQAYDALWDAVRSLRIAEPAAALPPMRTALKALDRARLAQRLYLRGGAPKVVVDIARVRLTGKEKGVPGARTPQAPTDSMRRSLADGFERALASPADSRETVERLSVLRVRALKNSPEFAAALYDAIEAMQQNRSGGPALIRARKALGITRSPLPNAAAWGGG